MNKVFLPRQLLVIVLLLTAYTTKSQVLNEGFEGAAFPPAGWRNVQLDVVSTTLPADTFRFASTTTETVPNGVIPHSGSGMALYDCYNFEEGDSAELVTPALDLSMNGPHRVKFWMFRDERYANLFSDSIQVFVNTTQTAIGGVLLGVINRNYQEAPVESATGWYQYSFNIPPGFNGTSNYIAFLGLSGFGTEIVIDDIIVESQPSGCAGQPMAGTISGPSTICAGANISLVNTGATEGAGMSYAWQFSASAAGPWANIPGQNNFTGANASQTTATYYRFTDTCSNSGLADVSNVIFVDMLPQNICYCKPPDVSLHSFKNDYISNVSIVSTTLNSSGGFDVNTGYTQVLPTPANNTAELTQVTSYTINATIEDGGPIQVSCWIDFDQSGTFDANEYADLTIVGTLASGSIQIPANALPGQTGFRIRARAANFANTDACVSFGSGETEDYVVSITANTAANGALVDIIPPDNGCNASNNVVVKLRNSGNQDIAANAATVALYITGANPQGPLTQTNPSLLQPGDTATLTFTCSFVNEGTNIDSAIIQSLAGDINAADDVIVTEHITLPAAVNAPFAEDFEGSVAGWLVSQLAGTGIWGLANTVDYPDYNPSYQLAPKSGSFVALFDSYNFSAGTISRLTSNCIAIPPDANNGCGYVMGFYFTQDAQYITLQDSIVVNVTIDGGNTVSRLGVVKRLDTTLSPTRDQAANSFPEWRLYTFDVGQYAGSTVQFAFDAYGNFGNQMGLDSFFVGPKAVGGNIALAGGQETGATLSPSLTQCTDADGWTYYADENSSRYLFGIQWDPSNTGANAAAKAQATAAITVDRKWYAAENVAQQKATYTMQRYWNVNLNGAVMNGPANVRFFYSQREFDSIIVAKNNFISATGGSDEGFKWFKTVSGTFVPSPSSVNFDSVVNDLGLDDVNTSGATINGVLYAQFDGITSFSGGTAASGVGPTTPLPVGLISFNAQRAGRVNRITWTTTQEINTDRFIIERGTDGRNFTTIGEVSANGNSSSNINYSYIDYTPANGVNFYRLKVVERNSSIKYSVVRSVRNEGTADIAVYPNPVKDLLMLNISSDRIDRAIITLTDMNGKMVQVKNTAISEGSNYINFNTAAMAKGTYILKIQLNEDMIIRKINKL